LREILQLVDSDAPLEGEEGIKAKQEHVSQLMQELKETLHSDRQAIAQLENSSRSSSNELSPNNEKDSSEESYKVQLALDRARVNLSEIAQLMHIEYGIDGNSVVGQKMADLRTALRDIEAEVMGQ